MVARHDKIIEQARIPQEVVDSFRAKRAEDEAQAETARVRAEQEMRSAP